MAAVPSERVFTLPNQLTFLRLGLAGVLFALIAAEAWWWCVGVFVLAAFTDWLDGWLARNFGMGSALGRVLDPLVDKVLMTGVFIFLLPLGQKGGWLTAWMVTVIVGREFLITGLRNWMESQGVPFGADLLGKAKMVLQCAAAAVLFLALAAPGDMLSLARDVLVWAMLAATVLSGLSYVLKAAALLGGRGK